MKLFQRLKQYIPEIATAASALAGVAGTIITPLYGATLANDAQAILQGLSAFLIAIPTYHVASVTGTKMKARYKA